MTSDFRQGAERDPFGSAPSGTPASWSTPEPRTGSDDGSAASSAGTSESTAAGQSSSGSQAGLKEAAAREASSAKARASEAKEGIRQGAADFASSAKERVFEGAERGKDTVSSGLEDFAAAIRKASDELGSRDQSMASSLVREVASGLEQATGSIRGKSIQDLTHSVAGFARRQPTAFLLGAALAGVALGRFARASGTGSSDAFGSSGFSPDAGRRSPEPSRSTWDDEEPVSSPSTAVLQPDPLSGDRPAGGTAGADDSLMGQGSGSFNTGGADHVR